jgi:hypothetical protein
MAVAWLIVFVLFYLVFAFALFGMFQKADVPTWWAFVPIFDALGVLRVAGRPWWWLLLSIVPIVDLVLLIIVLNDVSVSFGHGWGYTFGLLFLSLIFFYILSYGESQYHGAIGAIAPGPPSGELAP